MDKLKLNLIQKQPLKNLQEIEKDPKNKLPFASYKKQNPAFDKFLKESPSVVSGGKRKVKGGSFISDFADGFKKGFTGVMDVAKPFLPLLMGLGHEKMKMRKGRRPVKQEVVDMEGCGKSLKPPMIEELKAEVVKGGKKKIVKIPMDKVMKEMVVEKVEGGKKKRKASAKVLERAKNIKEIMQNEGVSMIQASKLLSQRNKK